MSGARSAAVSARLGVGLFALLALLCCLAPAATAAPQSVKITDALEPPVPDPSIGGIFFTKTVTFDLPASGGKVLWAGSSDGTAAEFVDDEANITVTGSGGTHVQTFDYTNSTCTAVTAKPPQDITSLFSPGTNTVTVRLFDKSPCGGTYSSSALWLALQSAPVFGTVTGLTGLPAVGVTVSAVRLDGNAGSLGSASANTGAYSLALPSGDWFVFTTWAVNAPGMPDPFPPSACPQAPPLTTAEQNQAQFDTQGGTNMGCAVRVTPGSSVAIDFHEQLPGGVSPGGTSNGGPDLTVNCAAFLHGPCNIQVLLRVCFANPGILGHCPLPAADVAAVAKFKKIVIVGKRKLSLKPGQTVKIRVKLNKKGRNLLKRFRKLRVQLIGSLTAEGRHVTLPSKNLTIKLKRKK